MTASCSGVAQASDAALHPSYVYRGLSVARSPAAERNGTTWTLPSQMPHRQGVAPANDMQSSTTGDPDESANADFDRTFSEHYHSILAYALRRVSSRESAEDVAAETFAIAWRRWSEVPADPLPWLYGVARRVLANDARSASRRGRLRTRLAANPSPTPRDPGELVNERNTVLAALDRLSEPEREVLRLVAWEGVDSAAGASALRCSRRAFALRLHRARRKLAKELAAAGHTPSTTRERTFTTRIPDET